MNIDQLRELLDKRQSEEIRHLQEEMKAAMKKASKTKKAELETKLSYDLRSKHNDEVDALEENGVLEGLEVANGEMKSNDAEVLPEVASKDASVSLKKDKNKRKKDRRDAREAERALEKEKIAATSGPSNRETETANINAILATSNLKMKEVAADGNCLYRSLADQLGMDFAEVRLIAANELRRQPEEYAPFIGLNASDDAYISYCDTVESAEKAEWGGQLELRAISTAVQRPIWVYSADAPLLKIGEEHHNEPMRVSYHKHFYSLGEHYNAVIVAV